MSLILTAVRANMTPHGEGGPPSQICNISAFVPFSDKNAVRFIPRENGVHSIDVKFNGCHIPGSPFKIRVGDPGLIGDPGMVTAHGPGLQGGCTGRRQHHCYSYAPRYMLQLITISAVD